MVALRASLFGALLVGACAVGESRPAIASGSPAPAWAPVHLRDLIVTSGMFNLFPKGFPIGTVTSIDKSRYGMTQEVEVRPAVEPLNLEELFIVLNANHQDLNPSTGAED